MKFVVVVEVPITGFIECFGVYDSFKTAVGEAFLKASESAENTDPQAKTISPVYNLECDTGVGFDVEFDNCTESYYVLPVKGMQR